MALPSESVGVQKGVEISGSQYLKFIFGEIPNPFYESVIHFQESVIHSQESVIHFYESLIQDCNTRSSLIFVRKTMSIPLVFFSRNYFDPLFMFSKVTCPFFFFLKHILSVIYENTRQQTSDVAYCHSVRVSRSAKRNR